MKSIESSIRAVMLVAEAKHRDNETGEEILRFVANRCCDTDVQKEAIKILVEEGLLSRFRDNRRYSDAA